VTLKSGIAGDQIWQFGPSTKVSVSRESLQDVNTIFYDDAEYEILGKKHAAQMLAKKVTGQ
jgi:mannan endo-1,4-beta-mannosidase